MNDNVMKGKWQQVKGDVKQFFGKLTDDDLTRADGDKDKLLGAMQERYGYNREEAEKNWGEFNTSISSKWDALKDNIDAAVDKATKDISTPKK